MHDLRCCDCMDLMREFPDKHFELAIVDPPYGIGVESWDFTKPNRPELSAMIRDGYQKYKSKGWDSICPGKDYFFELFRVSKNQIVWGANYYSQHLPPSRGWAYWNKGEDFSKSTNFSHGELAFTSLDKRLLSVVISPKSETHGGRDRIHPTQKPVALYRWLLHNYAKPGDKILDTHLGSGSIAIACHEKGFHLTGSELDPDYFAAMQKRLAQAEAQLDMFGAQP